MSTMYSDKGMGSSGPKNKNYMVVEANKRRGGVYKSITIVGRTPDVNREMKRFSEENRSRGWRVYFNTTGVTQNFIGYASKKISLLRVRLRNMIKNRPYILNGKGGIEDIQNLINETDILEEEVHEILDGKKILPVFVFECRLLDKGIGVLSEGKDKEEFKKQLEKLYLHSQPSEVDGNTLNDIKETPYSSCPPCVADIAKDFHATDNIKTFPPISTGYSRN